MPAAAIDASGVFPDGTSFAGIAGLKKALLSDRDQFVNTVAEKLLMYALGRNLQYYDAPAVRTIVRQAAASRLHVVVVGDGRREEHAVPDENQCQDR